MVSNNQVKKILSNTIYDDVTQNGSKVDPVIVEGNTMFKNFSLNQIDFMKKISLQKVMLWAILLKMILQRMS